MTAEQVKNDANRRYAFSNGSECMDYENSNCACCTKRTINPDIPPTCPLHYAYSFAGCTDGKITADEYERLGLDYSEPTVVSVGQLAFRFQCKEISVDLEVLQERHRRWKAQREFIASSSLTVRFENKYRRAKWFDKYWGFWAPSATQHPLRFWIYPIETRLRKRIAFWLDKHRERCGADLVPWWMSPIDHPFRDAFDECKDDGCREESRTIGSCYCGKWENGEVHK